MLNYNSQLITKKEKRFSPFLQAKWQYERDRKYNEESFDEVLSFYLKNHFVFSGENFFILCKKNNSNDNKRNIIDPFFKTKNYDSIFIEIAAGNCIDIFNCFNNVFGNSFDKLYWLRRGKLKNVSLKQLERIILYGKKL